MDHNNIFDKEIGTVLKIDKKTRKVGVYIPKLMSGMDGGEAYSYKVPTNAGLKIDETSTNILSTVKKINYIWIPALDFNEPLPKIGSKVIVEFIDNNPNLRYWKKFNINNDYDVIDEEKYSKISTLKIGNKDFDIFEDDNIIINLPPYFEITSTEKDKTKNIYINENYKFEKPYSLEESISKMQRSLLFLEDTYEKTFIVSINSINPTFLTDETSTKLKEEFTKTKNNGIDKIKISDDLLTSNNECQYYSKLLNGLSETYSEYQLYLNEYNQLADKSIVPSITENTINTTITNLFTKCEELSNQENIDEFIEFSKNQFATNIIFEYRFSGKEGLPVSHQLTEKVFTEVQQDIIPLITDETGKLIVTPSLISDANIMQIIQSNIFLYSWCDIENNIIYSRSTTDLAFNNVNKYLALSDTIVYPKFYGLYGKIVEDKLNLSIYNTTQLIVKSFKGHTKIDKTTKNYTSIDDMNNELNGIIESQVVEEVYGSIEMQDPQNASLVLPKIELTIKK